MNTITTNLLTFNFKFDLLQHFTIWFIPFCKTWMVNDPIAKSSTNINASIVRFPTAGACGFCSLIMSIMSCVNRYIKKAWAKTTAVYYTSLLFRSFSGVFIGPLYAERHLISHSLCRFHHFCRMLCLNPWGMQYKFGVRCDCVSVWLFLNSVEPAFHFLRYLTARSYLLEGSAEFV